MQAIVTQSLLLREALVLMFGSEFAWGVVLFAWLFGVAVGAVLGGWIAERLPRADLGLVVVLLLLAVAACVELWFFRGARGWLGVEVGEFLPLTKTALAALLFVSPTSALVGMAFPLACCVKSHPERRASARADTRTTDEAKTSGALRLGRVYAMESAGSLIGGAAFSFWAVEHLTPIQTALTCGAIVAASSAAFLAGAARKWFGPICLAGVAVAAILTSILAGESLNRVLVERRWRDFAPGYELCAEAESKYQNLAVGRREGQYTLYSDCQVTADFPDPYTFVPLAHFWLCQHPAPRNVLVLGGGAEGLLAEILQHPVEHVDYVEPDPRAIELVRPYLAESDRTALTDPRVTVHYRDARNFVKTQAGRFDLVIARLPEPMSALRARLYTEGFFRELRRAMTPRSVLCMTAAATPGRLSSASADYVASIRATLRSQFRFVTIGWGDPAHILAATEPHLTSIDPAELAGRYTERKVESDLFDPAWFDGATDWLEPHKLRERAAELNAATGVAVSTDLHPVIYLQRLALWERMTGVRSRQVIERLRSVGWLEVIVALAGMTALTLIVYWARTRSRRGRIRDVAGPDLASHTRTRAEPDMPWLSSGAVTLSVGSTGFVTMALSIVWLFAFQNLYGYVYQRIGWIVALFMAGLVVGCGLISWRAKYGKDAGVDTSRLWRGLILVDALMAALSFAAPIVLVTLGSLQAGRATFILVEWCISLLVLLTGVLGGAAFALAGGLQVGATGRPGAAAGSVVGADHVGACLGALLCGILLVPVFGTAAVAMLLAGIKLSSVALLAVGRRS
jgi:spermidine synthase